MSCRRPRSRYGAHIEPGAVLMPSYVNIGAWVGAGTMVDTWATVGSCAQIGADVHLAGGVGIGGVLEPLQAAPVVIEDGAFIGSRCIVVEGVHVGARAVLGAGVVLTGNTPLIDPRGGEPVEYRGRVPAGAIVVPGSRAREFPAGHLRHAVRADHRRAHERHRRQGGAERPAARLRVLAELTRMPQRPDDRIVESPIAATWRSIQHERAVLVGIGPGIEEADLDELAALADSAGAEPVGRIIQSRGEPDPQFWIGKGKVEELHELLHGTGAELVICDQELSPGHLRSLEARLGVKVLDRTALILDIFALHAHTREGKAQVELAQLNYLLPRLRGWGEAMSRLGGGIGTRGPGETKMESDRQHIRRRIAKLRRDVKAMQTTRDTQRASRQRSNMPQVAIAGYTNAGKSSLLRRLTGADVIVADQLFATLDPTTRRIVLPGGRVATLSDTVGFVSKLPHDLVEAFRSTLEEVTLSDMIVHVADAASPALEAQIEAVHTVLEEIGAANMPEVLVLNKIDLVPGSRRARLATRYPGSVAFSAVTGEGTEGLLEAIAATVPTPPVDVHALIPWDRGDLVAMLYRDAEVLSADAEPDGHAGARAGWACASWRRSVCSPRRSCEPTAVASASSRRSTRARGRPTCR